MTHLIIDLETVVKKELTELDLQHIKHDKRLKDKKKVEESKRKNAPFLPGVPDICSIGFGVVKGGEIEKVDAVTHKEESVCIDQFLDALDSEILHQPKIVGFNCESFDMPVLMAALYRHGKRLPFKIGKWDVVDLMRRPFYGMGGLKSICYLLGVEQRLPDTFDGSMVADAYHNGDLEIIHEYAKEDARMTCELLRVAQTIYDI